MYEFHVWLGLSDSTYEDDQETIALAVDEIKGRFLGGLHTEHYEVQVLNGGHFLTGTGFVNRYRLDESMHLDGLLDFVMRKLPGSYGLVYERYDGMPSPPGDNAFRVRVMARGKLTERLDPFLSPCNPVIED